MPTAPSPTSTHLTPRPSAPPARPRPPGTPGPRDPRPPRSRRGGTGGAAAGSQRVGNAGRPCCGAIAGGGRETSCHWRTKAARGPHSAGRLCPRGRDVAEPAPPGFPATRAGGERGGSGGAFFNPRPQRPRLRAAPRNSAAGGSGPAVPTHAADPELPGPCYGSSYFSPLPPPFHTLSASLPALTSPVPPILYPPPILILFPHLSWFFLLPLLLLPSTVTPYSFSSPQPPSCPDLPSSPCFRSCPCSSTSVSWFGRVGCCRP